jgi:putative ATP-dependent endonuclease of the OLD family
MIIKTISIQNFKCHKNIKDLPFHDLTTLIGENDSGKTTIIDFLEIMLTNATPSPLDYYRSMEFNVEKNSDEEIIQKTIIGEIIFSLDPIEKDQLTDFINENNDLHLRRQFSEDGQKISIFCKTFDDLRFYQFESMNAGDLKTFLSDLRIEDVSNQDLRKEAINKYIQSTVIPYHFNWRDITLAQIKNFFPKFIRYNTDDYKNPTNMIFKVLQEVYESELYTDVEGERKIKDENLKTVIESITKKITDASQQFIGHVQKYNTKIQEITIDPNIDLSSGLKPTQIKILDETGIWHYLESRGYGTKKRIFLAIFEWNKEVISKINQEYAIRCYDEPDDSLHIEAQRSLFKAIKSIIDASNKKNQVIICTHSLFMIDTSPASSINLIKREDKGNTSVEFLKSFGDSDIQKFIEVMCREMGLSNSHIFFEKCFILFEGPTEMNFLPLAYRKKYNSSLAEDGITLINLEGNGSAINFLKLLMKNKKDLTVLFLDKDTLHIKKENMKRAYNRIVDGMEQKEYEAFIDTFFLEQILYIGDKEFEDSFADAIIVQALNKNRKRNDGTEWSETEIKSLRQPGKKFSDQIIKSVSENCAPNYLSKPLLGLYLGEEITESTIPEKITELFTKCRKIAEIGD